MKLNPKRQSPKPKVLADGHRRNPKWRMKLGLSFLFPNRKSKIENQKSFLFLHALTPRAPNAIAPSAISDIEVGSGTTVCPMNIWFPLSS